MSQTISKRNLSLILCLFLGATLGFGIFYFLTRNDCFALNGQAEMTLTYNEANNDYTEAGARCIAFNQDAANSVTITYYYREDLTQEAQVVTEVNTSLAGIYYVVYTSNNLKYRWTTLTRTIKVEQGAQNDD